MPRGRPKGSKNKPKIIQADKNKASLIISNEPAEEGDFIPVKIVYYFDWKCPKCKKLNLQRYKNMYHCVGPEWSAIGVTCGKCGSHFGIEDDREGADE